MFTEISYVDFNNRVELTKYIAQNPSANVQTSLDIVDSTTGVNFDENGMICATMKKKRNSNSIDKFNRIEKIVFEFDMFSPDQHIYLHLQL